MIISSRGVQPECFTGHTALIGGRLESGWAVKYRCQWADGTFENSILGGISGKIGLKVGRYIPLGGITDGAITVVIWYE